MNKNTYYLPAGILLIFEALLIFVPMIILGAAINWPANLSEPASVNLPLVLSEGPAVRAGYFVYLIYSVLFWPVALMTAQAVAGSSLLSPGLKIAAGFGMASAVARTLGILRWFSAMPVLAELYVGGTPDTQATVAAIYDTVNAYGGAIGEALGVGLFAGMWMLFVAVAMLRTQAFPRWLGIFGLVAAIAVSLQVLELFGMDLGALITVLVAVLHFWMLAAGGYFLMVARRQPSTVGMRMPEAATSD